MRLRAFALLAAVTAPAAGCTGALGDFEDDPMDVRAVLCGRSADGMFCTLSDGTSFGPASVWQPAFSDANGWDNATEYPTIWLADVNGDNRSDVCGRGKDGIHCALSDGTSFGPSTLWSSFFSDDNGWNHGPEYLSTIRFPDLDGDGKADVCGRNSNGVVCALSTGTSFGPVTVWQSVFSNIGGWNNPSYYESIRFADVNGDKKADVCGRGVGGIACALSDGSSFGSVSTWQGDFNDMNGWTKGPEYYSTFQYADLDDNGMVDVCARGDTGLWCALSIGTSFGNSKNWQPDFSDGINSAENWSHAEYYTTIRLADLDGDGMADVCGRGPNGIRCALSTGQSFTGSSIWQPDFSDANGWKEEPYYSTIRFADINGDGKADVCGRGPHGIVCALSTGKSFGPATIWQPNYGDAEGWNGGPQYHTTIQIGLDH